MYPGGGFQIFDGLNVAFRGVEGRMTAKQVEDRYVREMFRV